MRALLRAALLLAAAACAGSQPAQDTRAGAGHAGIRLPLWRVKGARPSASPVQQGTFLHPVTQPPLDDEQLYNHLDACVPRRGRLPRHCVAQLQTLALLACTLAAR